MSNFEDLNMRGTRANQPTAAIPGRQYYVTDEQVTERDNGSVWQDISDAGSGASGTSSGYEYVYVEKSTSVTITATSEGTANVVITGSSTTYDGSTAVMIEFFAARVHPDNTAAGRYLVLVLLEEATVVGNLTLIRVPASGDMDIPVLCRIRRTPSNASHFYVVKAWVSAGTGNITAEGGGSGNAINMYLRVTKV